MTGARDKRQNSLALGKKTPGRHIVIQRSSLAGFRHHDAPFLWEALRPSLVVNLAREPHNSNDPDAVALFWRGRKLGYLPRSENFVVSRLLEGSCPLSARIQRMIPRADRNLRIQIEVLMH